MRKISDQNRINKAIEHLDLNSEFDIESLQFEIRIYEKGEQIVSPLNPMKQFIFVISGTVRVYQLDEDSTIHSIINIHNRESLGYNEFCFDNNDYTLYAEALAQVICLILPFKQPARNLKSDSKFLLFLLKNSLINQIQHSEMTHFYSDLEDKLIFYMENLCTDRTLTSVNDAVDALHCSRRQLQRTLKKLCDDQKLVHVKRGCYQFKTD
jgi:CRP-like cAMP-binding protein